MAITQITHITLYVHDQDEALSWYCDKFGFEKCMDDSEFIPGFRWLTISPAGNSATQYVLMPAMAEEDKSRVGSNAISVLATDDCEGDYKLLGSRGVELVDAPSKLPWGISAIVKDLYGNPYNLVEAND